MNCRGCTRNPVNHSVSTLTDGGRELRRLSLRSQKGHPEGDVRFCQEGKEVQLIIAGQHPKNNPPLYIQAAVPQPHTVLQKLRTAQQPTELGAQPPVNPATVKKQRKKFDPLPGPLSQLLSQLMAANLVAPIPLKPVTNPPPKSYNPNAYCEYHSGGAGHWTDRCFPLRQKIQDLIDQGTLNFHSKKETSSTLCRIHPYFTEALNLARLSTTSSTGS